VQVTEVLVAAETGQSIPSIVIVYRDVSVEKFSPVKVTTSPPSTVPYLGLMAYKLDVKDP
jgi:hypothetical protein